MANSAFAHSTNAGKVVYKRRTHLMGLSDALRIVRFVIANSRDVRHEKQELHDDFVKLQKVLITETAKKYAYYANDAVVDFVSEFIWQGIIGQKIEEIIPETQRYKDKPEE